MRHRRGFSTIVAVGLIGLIGATLAALAVAFSSDVKRGLHQAEDAQLRQLLIAGEETAQTSLAKGEAQLGKIELPSELTTGGMSVSSERMGDSTVDVIRVHVVARTADGRSMGQTLTFKNSKLQSAELD